MSLRTVVFLFMLVISLMLAGCSQSVSTTDATDNPNKKRVKILLNFKTGSLDPSNNFTPLRAGVVETLVRMNENLEVTPWLATKWMSEKDHRAWKFTIRDEVVFHDGTKLDAAAVKASIERGIEASKPLAAALKIASMEARGQELVIMTKEPHPALPSELVSPYAAIISAAAEKKLGTEAFNHAPVGTGPFKVKQFTPNMELGLERYDEYWDGKAKLEEVTITFNEDANVRALALQAKEVDIAYQVPAETVQVIQSDSALAVQSVPGLRVHFLLYNQQRPLLQDKKIRQAIDLLLDRESIANGIMLGHAKPANGPFNSRLPFGSDEPVRAVNPEAAKKLLEEAGYQRGEDGMLVKDGKRLSLLVLTYKGRPELPLIAQLLQAEAAKIGIDMQIRTVENIDTYLRENKDWDLVTYSNSTAPRGDGGFYLNSAFMPGGSLNPVNLHSERVSKIITQLNATAEMDSRVKLTKEAVKAINEEVLQSYAVYPNIIVGMKKRVANWQPGAEDYYIVTNQMDVK